MIEKSRSMFSDRRSGTDRRDQSLPIPAGLDRRGGGRRARNFQSLPWWLSINYAVELVTEEKTLEEKTPTIDEPAEGLPST